MRRNTTLAVNTNVATGKLAHELSVTPRSSIDSPSSNLKTHDTIQTPSTNVASPTPSIRLLFSLLSRRHIICLLLPAILSSIVAGGIAPFMTFVIGQAFDAFARFPLTPNPPTQAKDDLLRGVGFAALELVGLAVGSLALSSVTSSLWIWTGEMNVMALRKAVYLSVTAKDMSWFDTHMGMADGNKLNRTDENDGPIGAGGLMAKFTRETDDVRMATSLASGMLIQYLTTCLTCLVLAFTRSWALTLVILSTVPILMLIQGVSQGLASPLLASERQQSAIVATIIDRAVSAISTVKAFNAAPHEHSRADAAFHRLDRAGGKLSAVWGVTSALGQFVMMGMFVQGFWFGSKLVREGKISAGDVMAVFWACLIATSNMQMCIPQFIILAKGKFSMVSLISLATFTPQSRNLRALKKITPPRCSGELALHNVTFAYPSRPTIPVLSNVSIFLPANEITFIVGSSGSGKSTVAQLLLRMYNPQIGHITIDEQDVRFLDDGWMKTHVAGVSQSGVVILDGKSVFENVAAGVFGRRAHAVAKEEVEDACRAALIHEFVRDLPNGYDTLLGGGAGGVGLSGGQKQRLAIARARLRNPSVLILDEATSALDATSRTLVFEAIKRWRKNKTTIVITHDLSQITPNDFVYVLKAGQVVEQGYRYDLEVVERKKGGVGEFRKMMEAQRETGGFLPEKDWESERGMDDIQDALDEESEKEWVGRVPDHLKHQSMAVRPLTFGAWMFEAVAELVAPSVPALPHSRSTQFPPPDNFTPILDRRRRPSSIDFPSPASPQAAHTLSSRRFSLQYSPTSPTSRTAFDEDAEEVFEKEKQAIEKSGASARLGRGASSRNGREVVRARWDADKFAPTNTKVRKHDKEVIVDSDEECPSIWSIMRSIYPTVPRKTLIFIGLVTCCLSGAMTPIFSFLLSRLLFEVSIGAHDVSTINKFGGILIGIAAIDGILLGTKYFIMEICGMSWVTRIRSTALYNVMVQDKKWFDRPENAASRMVQVLVKDGEDARDLVAVVWGQCCVVFSMLCVGLVWAFITGWQVTLVGVGLAPVFAACMAVQSRLVAKCELRNKRAREEVAKGYYETLSNIRGIRCMAFEGIFRSHFDLATDKALTTGVRGAFVEGCTHGLASALIYLAEALLFYVGAVLIARGTYTYLQMVEVLNLVVFSVTIGSQLMAFTEKIARSGQAANDFNRLLQLDITTTDESKGVVRPELAGGINFNNVHFFYPGRPEVPVLRNVNLSIDDGECIAIVGPSGSGKSTFAALLQRLYEPTNGAITIGLNRLCDIEVNHLRDHVSMVSQHPNLFDATIAENIRYGNQAISDYDIRRAAKGAQVHDFILSLPQGYHTPVGENASLISGGQAQRLQIARALARPSRILILDECTSSLDGENQAKVLDTIRAAKLGRTTVMVTHKLEVMMMCDRIVVVDGGEVREQGTYDELMQRKGVFSSLASGGEWVGEW